LLLPSHDGDEPVNRQRIATQVIAARVADPGPLLVAVTSICPVAFAITLVADDYYLAVL
jgi:hypothetical protein